MTAASTDIGAQALRYLGRGWSVIPMRAREKRPLVPWLEFQQRLPTPEELRDWYRRWPDANVGIVTGAISGLVVVDIDAGHGGFDSLARLERQHGAPPPTAQAITGSGGRHLYFAHPGGVLHNRVGIEPGIDLRGDGGCVVAPPSVHPNGRRYAWAIGHGPDEMPPAPLPPWLHALAAGSGAARAHPLAHWRQLVREGVPAGERNSTLASLAGHLLWHGVDPQVVLDLLLCWNAQRCRPPLRQEEVALIVESISRLHVRAPTEARARP